MRLPGHKRKNGKHAADANEQAQERLADATELRKAAAEQAGHEQRTVIEGLREMRRRNNLAALVLDSIEPRRRP
jgi:hypothetical protein